MKNGVFFTGALLISVPFFLAFAPHDDPNSTPDAASNAAPAGIGQGGPFATNNIQVFGHLTLAEMGGGPANILANDCWGWTDSLTNKEYAICGLMHGTSFIDVSDPGNPLYLGMLPTQTDVSTWRDIKVFSDHAFIVSDNNGSHGMQIFDLTQLRTVDPASPQTFSNTALYSGVNSAHNVAINEDSGYAYIVGSNQAGGGLHAVNINDPTNPVFAGNFDGAGYVHDCQVVNYIGPDSDYQGQEVAFCCNGRASSDNDTLAIINVSNKTNMTQISRLNYPEPGYSHQGWLSEDQRYFFLGDELDERDVVGGPTRIIVWDCLDLDNPVYLGFALGPTNAIDHNMYVKGNKLFLSNYSAGMRVFEFDTANPLGMTEIAFVDTFSTDDDTDFDGVWSNYPYFNSGTIIINDRQNGMFAVRLTELEFSYPDGRPDLVAPAGQAEFLVEVAGFNGIPAGNSGVLHVDRGNGFESFPMNEISANLYEAVFPTTDCGAVVQYYVSAMSVGGIEVCHPSDAPTTSFSATSADSISTPFADNFETNQNWTISGNANAGVWERGVPAGDGDRGDPVVDGDSSGQCYLTENGAGNTDVDGGATTLTSPIMDAVGDGTAVVAYLKYFRWYSNDTGNLNALDTFVVEISNDAGQNWTNLETVGPNGSEVSGGWFAKSFEISDFLIPTDQMRIRFTASDFGDGSIVEAGVDGVEIMLVECADEIILGDVNQDGIVNLLDVAPFVAVISTGSYQAEADVNQDGVVNLLDVDLFVQIIAG